MASTPGVLVQSRNDAGVVPPDGQQGSDVTTQDQQLTASSATQQTHNADNQELL